MIPPSIKARYPNLREVNGLLYYRWRKKGRSFHERLPAVDDPSFDAAYLAAVQIRVGAPTLPPAPPELRSVNVRRWNARQGRQGKGERSVPAWMLALTREARKRAHRRGLAFTLTRAQLSLLVRRAAGRCEVTGLEFDHHVHEGSTWRPFAPSLDRRNCSAGYEFHNVRLVAVIVNTALNQWGEQPFWTMVEAASLRLRGQIENAEAAKVPTR